MLECCNVGWVRSTRETVGGWSAYLWVIQNRIEFLSSTTDWWRVSTTGAPVAISEVLVGTLGDYRPLSTNVDIGPSINTNFPGAETGEDRSFGVDYTNVFYRVVPFIWITPRSAYACVGGSNVQYSVTGTNIPQGVNWTLIPDLSGSGGAAILTNADWHYAQVTPGNVATNYKVRATSKDNTNFSDQVDFGIRKVDIVETNVYVVINNTAILHLTPDSTPETQWEIRPALQDGAYIQGSSIGASIVFNSGSIPASYTVKAYAEDLASCSDTCTVAVIKIEKIPLGGITNLSRNIIGKVYIPTKWGGSNMLSGTDFQLFYTDGADLSMGTAIQITKGELDGNRVAQGNPCVYEVPAGKFGWYYVKISAEFETIISSRFHEHGEVPRPWQGYYWSLDSNSPPNLYQDGYALDKYDQVYGTTAQVWEATYHISDIPSDGHCWGTAVASVLTNQPAATTSTNNVSFGEEDMEGLYIELAAFCEAKADPDYIVTNIPASPVSEELGEAIDDYCDEFHNVLSGTIIDQNDPLVGNLRERFGQDESAIWNHAVYKYRSEMQQMPGQEDESIIRVTTWMWSPQTAIYPSTGPDDRRDDYQYDVKFNEVGRIDGSWTNQNWLNARGFPPESICRIKDSEWSAENPEVSLTRVNQLYGH